MQTTDTFQSKINEIINNTIIKHQPFVPTGDPAYIKELFLAIYPVIKSYNILLPLGMSSLIEPFQKGKETPDMKLWYTLICKAMERTRVQGEFYYEKFHRLGNKFSITDEEFLIAGQWGKTSSTCTLAIYAHSSFSIGIETGADFSFARQAAYWYIMQSTITWFLRDLLIKSIDLCQEGSTPVQLDDMDIMLLTTRTNTDVQPLSKLLFLEAFTKAHIQEHFLQHTDLICKAWDSWFKARAAVLITN